MREHEKKPYPDSYDPEKLPQLFAILKGILKFMMLLTAFVLLDHLITGRASLGGIVSGLVFYFIIGWSLKPVPDSQTDGKN